MPQKIGIIMDPLDSIDIEKDTTFDLAMEAQRRDTELWYIKMSDMMMRNEVPSCLARQVVFQSMYPCYEWKSEAEEWLLDDFNLVLMRKDPPFDQNFFYATHFLSLCQKTIVVNRPESLREAPEKIFSLRFPGIFPPTLITTHAREIKHFMKEVGGEIIIKPLDGHGGKGIVYLYKEDGNFNSILEMATQEGRDPVMAQKYLPEVRQGDKRVICVNGLAEGAIWRIPSQEEHRANIHVGGRVEFVHLTKRDRWLVEQITETLQQKGLYFVGLDIIGDYVTEINVTSPTGIQEIKRLGGIDIARIFWDTIEDYSG